MTQDEAYAFGRSYAARNEIAESERLAAQAWATTDHYRQLQASRERTRQALARRYWQEESTP